MFTEDFLVKYPHTTAFVKEQIKQRTLKAFEGRNVEKDTMEMFINVATDDTAISNSLRFSPGNMLNILDKAGVHFFVYPLRDGDRVKYLYANINETPAPDASVMYFPERIEAEQWAVMEAFKMSENILEQIKA